ncbi:MAG: right-handed parallel beta-helix repeat-containing protein [Candidatus Oleimicrobiaceae bacterium]
MEITLFTRTPTVSGVSDNALLRTYGDGPQTYAVVNNGMRYQQSTEGSKGTKLTEITIILPPEPEPQKVTLTMAVAPVEAVKNGCTTILAPGDHKYNKGAFVNVMAVPQMEKGWYFMKWTGNVSGTNLITGVKMDQDKVAIANFTELKLAVSGFEDKRFFCASQINKEKRLGMLPVTLCAGGVDDWTLSRINLKSSGSGNEATDITEVNIFHQGSSIYRGKYAVDNGQIEASFQPPISIKAGECVTIYLDYDFPELDINAYAADEPKTFLVETGAVVAKPVHDESGLIAGKAEIDSFCIGRVYNSKKLVFARINEAIFSPKTTNGDTCFVCPGEYKESVTLNKDISLLGIEGAENTTINGGSSWALEVSDGNLVSGFTFVGSSTGVEASLHAAIEFKNGALTKFSDNRTLLDRMRVASSLNIELTNNKFYALKSLKLRKTHGCKIINNQPLGDEAKIELLGSTENEITGNSNFAIEISSLFDLGREVYSQANFVSDNTLTGVLVRNVALNRIIGNTISSPGTYGGVYIGGEIAIENTVEDNEIYSCAASGIEIVVAPETVVRGNRIHDNADNGLMIFSSSFTEAHHNTIYRNHGHGIVVASLSVFSKIYDNTVSDHQTDDRSGICVSESRNTKVYSNQVWRNCTRIKVYKSPSTVIGLNNVIDSFCLFTGISLDGSSPEIFGNSIVNNTGNGIFAENGSNPVVRSNNIFGNSEFGVNNADASVTIDAQKNWWGEATGTVAAGINGMVDGSNWMTQPIGLVMALDYDTLYMRQGQRDSLARWLRDWSNAAEQVSFTASSELSGWMISTESSIVALTDSTGGHVVFAIAPPTGVLPGTVNKIHCTAQSAAGSTSDSCVTVVFESQLAPMAIEPDSLVMDAGDVYQFAVHDFDSSGADYPVNAAWTASSGEIDQTGLYTASGDTGEVWVTAMDKYTRISATAHVFVRSKTGVLEKDFIPGEYSLEQNYPNPFNPTTVIKSRLPQTRWVKLEAYNTLCQRMALLVDERQKAGQYELTFRANDLASGLYFYRLQAGDFSLQSKMLLTR